MTLGRSLSSMVLPAMLALVAVGFGVRFWFAPPTRPVEDPTEIASERSADSTDYRLLHEPDAEFSPLLQTTTRWRTSAISSAIDRLESVSKKPDRNFYGRFHLICQEAGELRAVEALPTLILLISHTLDPETEPAGQTSASWAYYPAACAIVEIGGRDVVNELTHSLREPVSPSDIWVYAWVFQELLGHELAICHLEHELKNEPSAAARQQQAEICELLKEAGRISLRFPRPAPPSRDGNSSEIPAV